jgi:hypothetical protein
MFGSPEVPETLSVARQMSVARSFVYVDSSGEPPDVGHVVRARLVVPVGAETRSNQLSHAQVGLDAAAAALSMTRVRRKVFSVPRDGWSPDRSAASSSPARRFQPVVVEGRVQVGQQVAELLTLGIVVQYGEPGLGGPQRQLLVAEHEPRSELAVLELVLALDQLGRDDSTLTDLAQTVELLLLVSWEGLSPGVISR